MKFPIPFFRRTPKPSSDIGTNVVETAVGRGENSPIVKYQVRSVVSAGMEIRGDIIAHEGAVVDGTVVGNVTVTASNAALLVRASARVEGNIDAAQVLVAGEVVGDITARFVRLYPGSRVFGRVSSSRLLVDDGAVIDNDSIKVEADGSAEHRAPRLRPVLTAESRSEAPAPLKVVTDPVHERVTRIMQAAEATSARFDVHHQARR